MRQLASSIFDAVLAVTLLLGIPAAALHPMPATIAVAVAAVLLLGGRLVIERSHGRRGRARA